jgi:hypothetical protein
MALDTDCKTALSPYRDAASDETLVRLMRYLGATDEQIADYEDQRRRWGQARSTSTCSGLTGKPAPDRLVKTRKMNPARPG